jgi:formate hydrogenlyase transcriptional activator
MKGESRWLKLSPSGYRTSETHVLKMLSDGAPMIEVLNELCNFVDAKSPGVIPTVLLPDGCGHLRLAAGPKVPKIWNNAFNVLKVPSYASFLSTLEHQERPILIADMRNDPSFGACWNLALRQGVQAARCAPILSKDRMILGTLILFCPTPQPLGERDLELMEQVIHMAAIAIERHRNEEELREFSRRLYQSQDEGAPSHCPRAARQHGAESCCFRYELVGATRRDFVAE